METALQIDLSKPEAPAEQVLDSALGEIAAQPRSTEGKNLTRGRSDTTHQARLGPKSSHGGRPRSVSAREHSNEVSELGHFDETANSYSLQPVDEGFGAWSYVASAFAMFIVVWGEYQYLTRWQRLWRKNACQYANLFIIVGFPQSFPIFQTYLSTGESPRHPNSVILALLAPGLQDIEEGIMFQILPKAARYRQTLVLIGITTMMVSLILASLATEAWQIVLTQGILYGIGGIFLNFVHVSIFSEWFDKKKGQAMGLIWLGYRAGGLGFPLICQWLLDKHGFQQTLRVLIAPMLVLLLPCVVLFRGRYPAASVISKPTQPTISKIDAMRTPSVLFYLVVSILFGLVTNVPMMFITKFAADLGLDASDRALTLSLVFASNMLGTYALGHLSDKGFHQWLMGASAISASLIHILLWGFVKTKFGLIAYAICIGVTSGGR